MRPLLALGLLLGLTPPAGPLAAQSGKALFCAYGGLSLIPLNPPPEFERHFAVAVVEIASPREISNVVVSDFALYDNDGKPTKLKRVVQVEEFNRPWHRCGFGL